MKSKTVPERMTGYIKMSFKLGLDQDFFKVILNCSDRHTVAFL
jgi:hypothetical protein